jgi:hypothetical protein
VEGGNGNGMLCAWPPFLGGTVCSLAQGIRTQHHGYSEITAQLKIKLLVSELGHFINFNIIQYLFSGFSCEITNTGREKC